MEIAAVVVPIVLAIIGGLYVLSSSNLEAYRRLSKELEALFALIMCGGFGLMVGACLTEWKVRSFHILLSGLAVSIGALLLNNTVRFFDWLNRDKRD